LYSQSVNQCVAVVSCFCDHVSFTLNESVALCINFTNYIHVNWLHHINVDSYSNISARK